MVINPIIGVYIPIIRIPIEGGMSLSPIKRDFWPWHIWEKYLFETDLEPSKHHGESQIQAA